MDPVIETSNKEKGETCTGTKSTTNEVWENVACDEANVGTILTTVSSHRTHVWLAVLPRVSFSHSKSRGILLLLF